MALTRTLRPAGGYTTLAILLDSSWTGNGRREATEHERDQAGDPRVWRRRVFTRDRSCHGQPSPGDADLHSTKKQADSAFAEFVRDVTGGNLTTDASTIEEYLDRWLDHVALSKSPTTVRAYRGKIKRIDTKLGHVQLSKLTAQHLDRAYRQWLDEGLHPTRVHHLHGVLSAASNQAVKMGDRANRGHEAGQPPRRYDGSHAHGERSRRNNADSSPARQSRRSSERREAWRESPSGNGINA